MISEILTKVEATTQALLELACEVEFGHSYVEQPGTPDNVQVLKCSLCGHSSIGWSHGRINYE